MSFISDINERDKEGRTKLHIAAENGVSDELKRLLAAGGVDGNSNNDEKGPQPIVRGYYLKDTGQ